MKVETIASTLGAGTLALLVGALLLTVGICEGVVALLPEDVEVRWAVYGAAGLILCIVAYVALTRGTHEAEEKVTDTVEDVEEKVAETFSVKHQTEEHPLVAVGVAAVAGLVLARLLPFPGGSSHGHDRHRDDDRSRRDRDRDHDRDSDDRDSDDSRSLGDYVDKIGHAAGHQALTVGLHAAQSALMSMFMGRSSGNSGSDDR